MQETQETWVLSLCLEDLLEEEMATHSSISCLENPMDRNLVGYSPWGHKESHMTEQVCKRIYNEAQFKGFPGAQTVKSLPAMPETQSAPWVGRSRGEGNGDPLQYLCQENPVHRRSWQPIVHGVTKSQTGLSD